MVNNIQQQNTDGATLADRVYEEMRALIIVGELAPGTRLVQRQLAKRFGVSSIPVLEAIRRLERDGLVSSRPGSGAQVHEWSAEDIEGVYLLREGMEGAACRLFATHASEMDRLMLQNYGQLFDAALRAGDLSKAAALDIELHQHILRGTKSTIVYRMAENSRLISASIVNARRLQQTMQSPSVGAHDALIAALIRHDADLAEQAGKAHVRESLQRLLTLQS